MKIAKILFYLNFIKDTKKICIKKTKIKICKNIPIQLSYETQEAVIQTEKRV